MPFLLALRTKLIHYINLRCDLLSVEQPGPCAPPSHCDGLEQSSCPSGCFKVSSKVCVRQSMQAVVCQGSDVL